MNDTSPARSKLRSVKKIISERLTLFNEYRKTRSALKNGVEIYLLSGSERIEAGYLGPWKFNLTEVAIAGGISLAVIQFFSSLALHVSIPKLETVNTPYEAILNTTWSWFEPFFIPLFITAFVYMTAWSSLKKGDISHEKKAMARKAYLYFDGAYGLLPQTLLPIFSALGTSAFIQEISKESPLNSAALTIQLFVIIFMIWQLVISGHIIPNRLFIVNGYSNRTRRFWQKKLPTDPPWGKYILSNTFLAPIIAVCVIIALFSLASLLAYIMHSIRTLLV